MPANPNTPVQVAGVFFMALVEWPDKKMSPQYVASLFWVLWRSTVHREDVTGKSPEFI
jgi:hypothetical protein